jgi:hypothetical protein
MIWEQFASVLHVLYQVVGDFRSSLEVHMHVQHADVYVFYVYMQHSVPSCQTCHALSSQGAVY